MNRFIFSLLFILSFSFSVFAQCDFIPLGNDDKNQMSAYSSGSNGNVVLDNSGIPYYVQTELVFWSDLNIDSKLIVHKYENNVWKKVGDDGIIDGIIINPKITIGAMGMLYVVYQDLAHDGKATVKKYNGSIWSIVGVEGFSPGQALNPNIAVTDQGVPYIVYIDTVNAHRENKPTVMKYNGTSWNVVGNSSFSYSAADFISLRVDHNGIPYVFYKETDTPQGNHDKAFLKKFNGTSWVDVGLNTGVSAGAASYLFMNIDNNNVLYVTYKESDAILVKKYNGSAWVQVGAVNSNIDYYNSICELAFDGDNIPFILYNSLYGASPRTIFKKLVSGNWSSLSTEGLSDDGSYNLLIHPTKGFFVKTKDLPTAIDIVRHFDGTKWSLLGTQGFASGLLAPQFVVSKSGIAYVAFQDQLYNQRITVMKFDGSQWIVVGLPGLTQNRPGDFDFTVSDNEIPYVAFTNSTVDTKLSVKKFDGTSWVFVGPEFFSRAGFLSTSITTDVYGNPYITSTADYLQVLKFENNSWGIVGPSNQFIGEYARYTDIEIDRNNGDVVIIYSDVFENDKLKAMKYRNGELWTTIGNADISPGKTNAITLALNDEHVPYISYCDFVNEYKVTVVKFDGTNWLKIYNTAIGGVETNEEFAHIDLAIGYDNLPLLLYLAFADATVNLLKYNGTDWLKLTPDSLNSHYASYASLEIQENGTPYIMYGCIDNYVYKAGCEDVVTSTNSATTNPVDLQFINAYPNPSNGLFFVELKKDAQVLICNMKGEVIVHQQLVAGKQEIDLSSYAKGIYLLKIIEQTYHQSLKLIKN